eukprot:166156_1
MMNNLYFYIKLKYRLVIHVYIIFYILLRGNNIHEFLYIIFNKFPEIYSIIFVQCYKINVHTYEGNIKDISTTISTCIRWRNVRHISKVHIRVGHKSELIFDNVICITSGNCMSFVGLFYWQSHFMFSYYHCTYGAQCSWDDVDTS